MSKSDKIPRVDFSSLSDQLRSYMRSRGVPWHMFQRSFKPEEFVSRFQYETQGKPRVIHPDLQLASLKRTWSKPLERPYLMVIGTGYEENLAGALALSIFEKVCAGFINGKVATAPLWHPVQGGFDDRLRDDSTYKMQNIGASMLVLSNIAANSTNPKIEKIRDLALVTFQDVPRIITVAGMNPVEFCQKVLYTKPDRVIYLAERKVSV